MTNIHEPEVVPTTRCARCGDLKAPSVLDVCGWCPPGFHPLDESGAYTYESLGKYVGSLDVGDLWCRTCGRLGARTLLFGGTGLAAVVYQCGHWQRVNCCGVDGNMK